ncbi:hypothetical protein COO60DRAFT_308664 [Scenedesmus sp. NREL 46B-D3]|nr:hypothetical protein COO60DRAFT_308664 [Scenedesmus sp. NREL 46B-D3]
MCLNILGFNLSLCLAWGTTSGSGQVFGGQSGLRVRANIQQLDGTQNIPGSNQARSVLPPVLQQVQTMLERVLKEWTVRPSTQFNSLGFQAGRAVDFHTAARLDLSCYGAGRQCQQSDVSVTGPQLMHSSLLPCSRCSVLARLPLLLQYHHCSQSFRLIFRLANRLLCRSMPMALMLWLEWVI